VVVVVVFSTGLIGSGGGTVSSQANVILEDSSAVAVMDVAAVLAAPDIPALLSNFFSGLPSYSEDDEPDDWKEEWLEDWEDDNDSLPPLDEISTIMVVNAPSGEYVVISGSFAFADLRSELEDNDYEEDAYRDQEIWNGAETVAPMVLDGMNAFVVGQREGSVQAVLRAIDREEGFIDSEYPLAQALDNVGNAMAVVAATECESLSFSFFSFSLRGCEAGAEAVTGGDLDTTLVSGAYVFGSERRTESGLDDIEDGIEDQDRLDVDLTKIESSGLTVSYEAVIYEE